MRQKLSRTQVLYVVLLMGNAALCGTAQKKTQLPVSEQAVVTAPGPTGIADLPTCTLTASPPNAVYNCSALVSAVTLMAAGRGIITSATIFGTTPINLPYSQYPVGPGTYNAQVTGPGGSGACSVYVGMVCQFGVDYRDKDTWGYPYSTPPPECQRRYQCTVSSCADNNGGWNTERGCGYMGCFAAESLLLLGDGGQKRADQVQKGDTLWNPIKKRAFEIERRIVGPEKFPLLQIGYAGTSVKVTIKHPMFTKEGLKKAEDIILSDLILGADLEYHKVTLIRAIPAEGKMPVVYNFRLVSSSDSQDDHLIVADGVTTGDHYLQELLEKKGSSIP